MIAGDFLRVRVEVDVSKPLCRGRKVILDDKEEVWVAFKYEKLPNFCYWCGMVCHDDKDCDIWLSSKGLLPLESQEFRAWMRATPFNLGRKTFCSVLGLEVFHAREANQEDWNDEHGEQAPPPPPSSTDHDEGSPRGPILNLETLVLLEKNSLGSLTLNLAPTSGIIFNSVSSTSHMEHDSFEIQIHEIDKELTKFNSLDKVNQVADIHKFGSHPNTDPKNLVMGGKIGDLNLEIPGTLAESTSTLPPLTTSQLNPTLRKWK